MEIKAFMEGILSLGIDYFAGVPDSHLRPLCDALMESYGLGKCHHIAANEGAAVALGAGHYLSTGKIPMIYMQNSGIGNAVNPICSLMNERVYSIPCLLVIGWRGEPGVKDEPQHIFQGEITKELLDCLKIKAFVLTQNTSQDEFSVMLEQVLAELQADRQAAIIIGKGALIGQSAVQYENDNMMSREEIVQILVDGFRESDVFVSTTGKLSRELFETREARGQSHQYDFLTVGSMGHASMIAFAIAQNKKDRRVFCLDGDGAVIMHTGSLALIGANQPENFVHIMINNGAHETVGGMPTVSGSIHYGRLALALGYKKAYSAETKEQLQSILQDIQNIQGPIWIEVKANLVSRADLGRPSTTPTENKLAFMSYLDTPT